VPAAPVPVPRRFEGRSVVVTGAGTGFGAEIAVRAAQEGARAVGVHYRSSADGAKWTADRVAAEGSTPVLLQADIVDWEQIKAMADAAFEQLDGVDAVVNNVGGVVVAGIAASGATVSPFFPEGVDPRVVSADGRPANPEDLLIAYALGVPYAGQHGDDQKRWEQRFGGLAVDPADSLGMAPAPAAHRQAQLDWARGLCDAAMDAASRRGVRVAVAVVDRGGDPVQQDLMDGAPAGGVAIAQAVAGAAALFDCCSGNLGARFGQPDGVTALAALVVPPVLGIPGGLPVRDGGHVVAGFGVGGGDPDVCAEIARIALDAS
jgi:uncharacterized protein GlcG (DUF336 family)